MDNEKINSTNVRKTLEVSFLEDDQQSQLFSKSGSSFETDENQRSTRDELPNQRKSKITGGDEFIKIIDKSGKIRKVRKSAIQRSEFLESDDFSEDAESLTSSKISDGETLESLEVEFTETRIPSKLQDESNLQTVTEPRNKKSVGKLRRRTKINASSDISTKSVEKNVQDNKYNTDRQNRPNRPPVIINLRIKGHPIRETEGSEETKTEETKTEETKTVETKTEETKTKDNSQTSSSTDTPAHQTFKKTELTKILKKKGNIQRKQKKSLPGTYRQFFDLNDLCEEHYDSKSSSTKSDSGDVEVEEKPDMEWIMEENLDPTEDEDPKTKVQENESVQQDFMRSRLFLGKKDTNQPLIHFLTPYFMTNWLLGRLPFSFYINTRTATPECSLNRKTIRFALFVFTSIIMIVSLIVIAFSFFEIVDTEVQPNDSYQQLEKLLLQKWWLAIMLFTFALLISVIGSISIIYSGNDVATYINGWFTSVTDMEYDIQSKGMLFIAWLHPICTILMILITLILYFTKAYSFHESTEAVTVLLFRNFVNNLALKRQLFRILNILVVIFQLYVFFCARSFVLLVVIFCRGIISLSREWNFRIRLLLRKVPIPSLDDESLKKLKSHLKYEIMLKEHLHIVGLIRGISSTFSTLLVFYTLMETVSMACSLFSSSSSILFDFKSVEANVSHVKGTEVAYEKTRDEDYFEFIYYLTSTLIGFSFTVWSASGAGEMVMAGFDTIRRHGLILSNGATERKFVLSLVMSFNSASPHIIQPGGWFSFDRGLIMTVFGGTLTLFSILIQLQVVRLINIPILFTCFNEVDGTASICVGEGTVNFPPISDPRPYPLADSLRLLSGEERRKLPQEKVDELIDDNIDVMDDITFDLPDVDGPGFLNIFSLNQSELNRRCLRFCKGTFVVRVVAFKSNGERYPLPSDTKECVQRPYVNITEKTVFNCLQVPAKEKDDCFMPNLSKDFVSGVHPEVAFYPLQKAGTTRTIKCFEEAKKDFGPLESCRFPFTTLSAACDGDNNLRWGKLAFRSGNKLVKKPELCNISEMNPDQTPNHTYEIQKGYVENFEVEINGTKHMVLRNLGVNLPAITQTTEPQYNDTFSEFIIPLPPRPMDKLFRPYAFIHPKLMSNKIYPYGYFDCFGNPMKEFDDCGNLGFSIVSIITGGKKTAKPARLSEVTSATTGKKYRCFESRFSDYKCGVPAIIMDETCRLWKEYSDSIPT